MLHDPTIRPDPFARLGNVVSLAPPPRVGLGAWRPEDPADLLARDLRCTPERLARALDDAGLLLSEVGGSDADEAARLLFALRDRVTA